MKSDSVKGNVSYEDWLNRVDNVLLTLTGVSRKEVHIKDSFQNDMPWFVEYELGSTPREAVEHLIDSTELTIEEDVDI